MEEKCRNLIGKEEYRALMPSGQQLRPRPLHSKGRQTQTFALEAALKQAGRFTSTAGANLRIEPA